MDRRGSDNSITMYRILVIMLSVITLHEYELKNKLSFVFIYLCFLILMLVKKCFKPTILVDNTIHHAKLNGIADLSFEYGTPASFMLNKEKVEIEQVDTVAIKTPKGIIYTVSRPGRHKDLIKFIEEAKIKFRIDDRLDYGFLTTKGKFLSREEASLLAATRNQFKKPTTVPPTQLFSEDLW